jgi:hypothetical protein
MKTDELGQTHPGCSSRSLKSELGAAPPLKRGLHPVCFAAAFLKRRTADIMIQWSLFGEIPLLSRLFLRVVHFTILIIVTIRMTKKLMNFGFSAYLQDFLPCSRWDVTILGTIKYGGF